MYKRPEVLVTHTKEMGEILSALHDASGKLGGAGSIPTAIAIAQLVLKHRQNKNLRQRVLVFAGSPLQDTSPDAERALVRTLSLMSATSARRLSSIASTGRETRRRRGSGTSTIGRTAMGAS